MGQFDPRAPAPDSDPDQEARDAEKRRNRDQRPLPGSIADTNQQKAADQTGPRISGQNEIDRSRDPEYTGPAVLSRSYSLNQQLLSRTITWQETFGMSTFFDTGATGSGSPAPDGQSTFQSLKGSQMSWSLLGSHSWRKERLSFGFNGSNSHYFGSNQAARNYSGANNGVTLDFRRILTPHLIVSLTGTGTYYSQNYALENPGGAQTDVANINIASSPNIQIFDAGSKQFSTALDFAYQKSARLSFDAGIGYFAIERNAPGYFGTTGQNARGDVTYRLTRRLTVGGYYSWNFYLLPHGAGDTHSNTVGIIYSYAFGRSMQVRFRAGGTEMETVGLTVVRIDPVLARLLGQSAGIIDAYRKLRMSDFSAQLIKDFGSRRSVSFSYARGISPGNGVYQASQQESIGAGITNQLWRDYRISFSGGIDNLKSVAQTLGNYGSKSVSFSASRSLGRRMAMNVSVTMRHVDVTDAQAPLRNQFRITTGISYSPGEGRLIPR